MLSALHDRANGPVHKNMQALDFKGQSFADLAVADLPSDCSHRLDPQALRDKAGLPARHPAVGAGTFVYQVPFHLLPEHMCMPCGLAAMLLNACVVKAWQYLVR